MLFTLNFFSVNLTYSLHFCILYCILCTLNMQRQLKRACSVSMHQARVCFIFSYNSHQGNVWGTAKVLRKERHMRMGPQQGVKNGVSLQGLCFNYCCCTSAIEVCFLSLNKPLYDCLTKRFMKQFQNNLALGGYFNMMMFFCFFQGTSTF